MTNSHRTRSNFATGTPNPAATIWKREFGGIDPIALRIALYTLRLLRHNPKTFGRALDDADDLRAAWKLAAPLLEEASADVTAADASEEDEFDESPSKHVRRWRREVLLSVPLGVLNRLTKAAGKVPTHPCIRLIGQALGLSAADTGVLDFVEKRHQSEDFATVLRALPRTDGGTNLQRLATVLDLPIGTVRESLAGKAILRTDELVCRESRHSVDFEDFLSAGNGLLDIMTAAPTTEQELIEFLLEPAPAAVRRLGDFPHLHAAATRVSVALRQAARTGIAGVNALFYGAPGVGKTELASAVAADAGLQAFRVRSADEDGDGLSRNGRLAAYRMAQRLLGRRGDALIIFDEVEDVFANERSMLFALFGGSSSGGEQKGAMNRTLEDNPVPAIWITNDAAAMDPAFLRRFLLPVEFALPPRAVRRQMVDQHLGDSALPAPLLDALAADDKLAPAQFGAAKQLLALHQAVDDPVAGAAIVQDGVAAMRRLLHGSGRPVRRQSATVFDPRFLNVSGGIAPAAVATALAKRGRGSLCFYGMPGTGKTEFAHVLTDALGRELVVQRVSDLVSKYVGETERQIANLFDQTDPERCVLLFDEVDSFLRNRQLAQHSWEVTQVNELLQHMESFPGIFIAATNLVSDLDPACLRRFDFKLHFRPLDAEQRIGLYAREVLGTVDRAAEIPATIRARLAALPNLTAGDFANVCRQRDLLGEALSPQDFLRRLTQECQWTAAASASLAA